MYHVGKNVAWSFCGLTIHQGPSAKRRSAARKKKLQKLLIDAVNWPSLPIGAVNIPHFANKRQMPCSANNNSCGCYMYSAITIGARSLIPLHLFFQNSPIKLGSNDRIQKKGKNKMETT
jgi:hypothetical protein